MNDYLTIRNAAVEQIKAGILPLYPKMAVEPHPGLFTEQSIRRDAQRTPAILTSLVKFTDGGQNRIVFVSWVLYRATSEDRLYDGALQIVSALTAVIRKADFDLVIKDTDIEAGCLFSGALDQMNITLWAVKWELALGDHAIRETGPLDELEYFDGTAIVGTGQIGDHANMED
ncbi:MAG: hypothetical protein LBT87_04760 [Treponema sp.]|nr:hypothetical protein [Treponema sp.]